VGVESFIHKPFLPHLLVCHCMSGSFDTQVMQHELGDWDFITGVKDKHSMNATDFTDFVFSDLQSS